LPKLFSSAADLSDIGAAYVILRFTRMLIFRTHPVFLGGNKMGTVSLYSSDALSNASFYSTQTNQQAVQTTNATASTASAGQDTVKLSETAQVKLLYKQGESVSAIASSLGTTTKEVNDELGIEEEQALEQTLQETEALATNT
jgi:hypothetical protein